MTIIPSSCEVKIRASPFKASPYTVSWDHSLENKKRKGGVAQVVKHPPSKCEVLSSIPCTVIKKETYIYKYTNKYIHT
jgi:hypothetical protein